MRVVQIFITTLLTVVFDDFKNWQYFNTRFYEWEDRSLDEGKNSGDWFIL